MLHIAPHRPRLALDGSLLRLDRAQPRLLQLRLVRFGQALEIFLHFRVIFALGLDSLLQWDDELPTSEN